MTESMLNIPLNVQLVVIFALDSDDGPDLLQARKNRRERALAPAVAGILIVKI
jgi:hypothetical protein